MLEDRDFKGFTPGEEIHLFHPKNDSFWIDNAILIVENVNVLGFVAAFCIVGKVEYQAQERRDLGVVNAESRGNLTTNLLKGRMKTHVMLTQYEAGSMFRLFTRASEIEERVITYLIVGEKDQPYGAENPCGNWDFWKNDEKKVLRVNKEGTASPVLSASKRKQKAILSGLPMAN